MKNLLFSKIVNYLNLLRIKSWPKNFFVFVPLMFSKYFFENSYLLTALSGFFIFCLASSAIYIINDLIDAPKDAIHPSKKNRPIANGSISVKSANALAGLLFLALIGLTAKVNLSFMLLVWTYILINILYSGYLKKIVIVDIFCIASGFMLRVISGALIISVYISSWLILTTIFISLFLAVMKRRVEVASSANAVEQRAVLQHYSLHFIDQIAAMTSTGVIMSYALYSVAERTVKSFGSDLLVFTTLFVIFGIFRYMFLVYKKDKGENVIEVIVTDWPMMINLFLYIVTTFFIIYSSKL
jgi:decaprenyl-phosphate phosphoribosyltransferase